MRLIVADDSVLFRSGLERLLRDADFEVIGLARDADELRHLVERDQPDVVIVDIRLPPGYSVEGLQAARVIRDRWPEVGVLLLSQYVEPAYARDVTALGTRSVGYLLKDGVADIGELADAVRRVGSGGSAIDAAVVACLMAARHRDTALEELTRRERAILALMAEGHSNEAICERLHIGPKTMETHVSRIFSKLGLPPTRSEHRRVMAILSYLRARNGGGNPG